MRLPLPKTKGMLRREAATWLARLESGRNPDLEREFERWRHSDSRHAHAFDRVRRSYEQAGLLRNSPIAAIGEPELAGGKPRWQLWPALTAAAAAVLLVPVAVSLVETGHLPFLGTDTIILMTAVGEIRQVSLADGSKVTLDTSTKLQVDIGRSRRSAHLKYGRARFQIVEAEQPFVIDTATTTISTRQGLIDVERRAQQDRIQVLGGTADVLGSAQGYPTAAALDAGEGMILTPNGSEPKASVLSAPDWTRGMLQFDGTAVNDAVALANRYSERHIILAGDVQTLRVTGAFRAGDTIGLAKALAAAFGMTLQQRSDGSLLLSRGAVSSPQKKIGG